jgi:NAD(P)-dependent dehydrogenase (short-subunit alcohol dehydrogenase family)
MQLTDRVALITGAGSGIGKAATLLLAKEGAKIAALGRTEDEVNRVVQKIDRHSEAIPLIADISQPAQMQRAVQQIADRWGRLDIVFANAGINGV